MPVIFTSNQLSFEVSKLYTYELAVGYTVYIVDIQLPVTAAVWLEQSC